MYQFVIKDIRKERKLTLRELSEKTGLSVSYLSEIENNKVKEPSFIVICKICAALGEKVENIYFAPDEIDSVRNMLEIYIEKYGLTDIKTQNISKILDKITVEKLEANQSKKVENIQKTTIGDKKVVAFLQNSYYNKNSNDK